MQKFDLDITLITPISDIPLKLNFFYKQTLCHEFWFMPWETGLSKTVSFPIHVLDKNFVLNNLDVYTQNNDDILFESILVNQEVQKLSGLAREEKRTSKTVSAVLNVNAQNYSVVKISDLPDTVSLSYGYNCNKSIYIPGCDIGRATLEFSDHQNFQFTAELFKANIVEADKELICHFENGTCHIEEKIKLLSPEKSVNDVKALKNKIAEHYETRLDHKKSALERNHNAPIIDIQNANNIDEESIIKAIQKTAKERFYSVIKLCGLPKNIFKTNIFYNDGAYFLTKENIGDLAFKNIKKLKGKSEISVHFFGESTETPLKTLILHLEAAQETAPIKTKRKSRARKKSA